MLRAVSDKSHGLNGFMNEITADLRHVVNTVQSAHEIGVIRKEQVINIIDSVVQRSSFGGGEGAASVNIKDSVVQRTEFNSGNDGKSSKQKPPTSPDSTYSIQFDLPSDPTSPPLLKSTPSLTSPSNNAASSKTQSSYINEELNEIEKYIKPEKDYSNHVNKKSKMNMIAFFGIGLVACILIVSSVSYLNNTQSAMPQSISTPSVITTQSDTTTPSVTTTQPEYNNAIPGSTQATQKVSSNFMIKNIEGVRAKKSSTDMSSTIDLLKIKVGLNVGSAPVDVKQMVVSITDGKTANNLIYAGNVKSYGYTMSGYSSSNSAAQNLVAMMTKGGVNQFYTVEKIRDEDASFSQDNPVMNTGDLITIYVGTTSSSATEYQSVGSHNTIGLDYSGLNLVPRTTVSIVLTPEAGAATTSDFVTPSSYGVKETVALYP